MLQDAEYCQGCCTMRRLSCLVLLIYLAIPLVAAENTWTYSSYFGGCVNDTAQAAALDPVPGNVYVAGSTSSSGPPFVNDGTCSGPATRVYLAKFATTGRFVSAISFTGAKAMRAMYVDGKGQVYLAL